MKLYIFEFEGAYLTGYACTLAHDELSARREAAEEIKRQTTLAEITPDQLRCTAELAVTSAF